MLVVVITIDKYTGRMNALGDYSRVLEIDPITLKIVWQYTPAEAGYMMPFDSNRFYSPFISGAQRLPNGNTLITEGSGGRIIEVTPDHELIENKLFGKLVYLTLTGSYNFQESGNSAEKGRLTKNITFFYIPDNFLAPFMIITSHHNFPAV